MNLGNHHWHSHRDAELLKEALNGGEGAEHEPHVRRRVSAVLQKHPHLAKGRDEWGSLLIHKVIRGPTPNMLLVERLLDHWPDSIREKDGRRLSLAHIVAIGGHEASTIPLLVFLHSRWPECMQEKNDMGSLPLHSALSLHSNLLLENVVKLVSFYPESLRVADGFGFTPLSLALKNQGNDVIEFMAKEYPVALQIRDAGALFPIHRALSNRRNVSLIRFLVDMWPECLSEQGPDERCPVHLACGAVGEPVAYKESLEFLLQRSPIECFQQRDSVGNPLLHQFLDGYFESSPFGEEFRLDGRRPVDDDLDERNGIFMKILARWPMALKTRNQAGALPIHFAAANPRNSELIRYLVDAWPDSLGERDCFGRYPLHMVGQASSSEATDFLDSTDFLCKASPDKCFHGQYITGNFLLHDVIDSFRKNGVKIPFVQSIVARWPCSVEARNASGDLPIHIAEDFLRFFDTDDEGHGLMESLTPSRLGSPLYTCCLLNLRMKYTEHVFRKHPKAATKRNPITGNLPLHEAVCHPSTDIGIVKMLVDRWPDTVGEPGCGFSCASRAKGQAIETAAPDRVLLAERLSGFLPWQMAAAVNSDVEKIFMLLRACPQTVCG